MFIAILGMLLLICLPAHMPVGKLVGYYLTQASAAPFVALLSLIATNIAGSTKKTTAVAMYFVAYCVGNIIGPQAFQAKDAPGYKPAKITILVCYCVSLADLFFIYWWCKRENRRKAVIRALPTYMKVESQEFLDLTDRENPEFIYGL